MAAATALRPRADPDVWWHLRTAAWIVEHGTVPLTDPFSMYGADRPWVAYSWLFELLLLALYRSFGLLGVVVYAVAGAVAVTLALHLLISRYEASVPRAVAITVLGLVAITPLFWPRSYLVSIVLFTVEMHVLLVVRETNRGRPLLLLPPLFALWANIHIQFVYGLFILAVAAVEPILQKWLPDHYTAPKALSRVRPLMLTLGACIAMCLATPYHIWIVRPLIDHVTQAGTFDLISELQAPRFRDPTDWVVLAITLAAVYCLGRQRRCPVFPVVVFVVGVFVSFRAQRDIWFVVIAALVILVLNRKAEGAPGLRPTWGQLAIVVGIATSIVAGLFMASGLSRRVDLETRKAFPVDAATFVERHQYAGPLYNHYDWGGYLMWRLPKYSVAMDGRANVYGPDKIRRSVKTWAGLPGWESDTDLLRAKVVIASRDFALSELLRRDSRFARAYEDEVATVFIARP